MATVAARSSTGAGSVGKPRPVMAIAPQKRPESRLAFSTLQQQRLKTAPNVPSVLTAPGVEVVSKEALGAVSDHAKIEELFPKTYGRPRIVLSSTDTKTETRPLRVGVVLSGGQASGGHNVIAGVYDYVKRVSPDSMLLGFAKGPKGIFTGKYYEVDDALMDSFRNTGGFDMLGSGRDKIESAEHFQASMDVCQKLELDGLVVIGGDDSNTNGAVLAEYFEAHGCKTKVVGVPKTIDGDLKNEYIPISFGFDTACKTYSQLIGNVMVDCISSQKYYHFVRLMGRSASHIAMECAFETNPNAVLIGEEVQANKMSLSEVTHQLVDMIVQRANQGKNYGVVLLPEGLIEFIPEFDRLMKELNELMAQGVPSTEEAIMSELSFNNRAVFSYLPANIKEQLLLDRDPHGNVQVAKIETEKLLAGTIAQELEKLHHHGKYNGHFRPQFHSFGYEGRAGLPSEFDANYCYALGLTAGNMIGKGLNALMVSITNICAPVKDWVCGGVPVTMMMNIERRKGKDKPVIRKALVELQGKPFQVLQKRRAEWILNDFYTTPGPIQFHGGNTSDTTQTLLLEQVPEVAAKALATGFKPRPFKQMGQYIFSPTPMDCLGSIQKQRLQYKNRVPQALAGRSVTNVDIVVGQATQCVVANDRALMKRDFPNSYGLRILHLQQKGLPTHGTLYRRASSVAAIQAEKPTDGGEEITVGVVFCGRQFPGGHNVIAGMYDFLKPSGSRVVGFVGGVHGIFNRQMVEITDELLSTYRNQGGLDLLGRSQETFDSPEHLAMIKEAFSDLNIDACVFVGGCRTATGVALLNEYLHTEGCPVRLAVVPSGIDGTMSNQFVETSIGYDTACRVYSELVGNSAIDGASAKKYYMFLRLMGTAPSNIALEVAIQSSPNMVLLAEDVDSYRRSLQDIVREIANLVCRRSAQGKDFGTILVPEGLVTSIPEMAVLINEIDEVFRDTQCTGDMSVEALAGRLTSWSAALLRSMPAYIQSQLCQERQSNSRVQLSQIETERLLAHFVEEELERRRKLGQYNGKFLPVCSFLGYQARGSLPSNFDCNYAYSMGAGAASLLWAGYTGYMASITGCKGVEEKDWKVAGVPLTAMLVYDDKAEQSYSGGVLRPRVLPKKVTLKGAPYRKLVESRKQWENGDYYRNTGPLQFEGPTADSRMATIVAEDRDYLRELDVLHAALEKVRIACRPGCSSSLLYMATKSILTLTEVVSMMDEAASSLEAASI